MPQLKQIRVAVQDDLFALTQLFNSYRCFYQQANDPKAAQRFIAERLAQADSIIFIAESSAQELMGFTQLYPTFSSISMKRAWILNDLYIDAAYRQAGVAHHLLQTAIDFARESNAAWVSLQTAFDNTHAQALYEKIGFKRDAKFLSYVYEL